MMLTQNITITANSPQSVEREFTERTEEKTALSANRIDVWKADLDHTSAALMFPYLSDDEWTRAQRFHQEIHRNRFIAGRALVRMALSRYLGCKPAEIDFNYNLWGKPCLTNGDLQFNVAHSEEHFLLAVSREAVGVDIERIRTIEDIHLVARTVFSPEELTAWTLLPEPEQVAAFYKIWTRKEALLKALGRGITEYCPLVSVLFAEKIPTLPPGLSTAPWRFQDLQISPEAAVCVATTIPSPEMKVESIVLQGQKV